MITLQIAAVAIIFGIAIILHGVLKIRIPFFHFLFGFLTIYAGTCLVIQPFGSGKQSSHLFNYDKTIVHEPGIEQYHIICSNCTIDLRNALINNENQIEIATIMSNVKVLLPKNKNCILNNYTTCGRTILPNNEIIMFGEKTTTNQNNSGKAVLVTAKNLISNVHLLYE